MNGERKGESSLLAHWPRNHLSPSAADRLEPEDVCAAARRTFHPMIVGFQAALSECLIGKIPYEGHRGVHNRRRRQCKQQASLADLFCRDARDRNSAPYGSLSARHETGSDGGSEPPPAVRSSTGACHGPRTLASRGLRPWKSTGDW